MFKKKLGPKIKRLVDISVSDPFHFDMYPDPRIHFKDPDPAPDTN